MPRTFRCRLPFKLPPRWMVVTGAAYFVLALAFALLLVGPRLGVLLTSHAQPANLPPAPATIAVTTSEATVPAADEDEDGYIPVPAGAPSTDASTSIGTSAGQP